MIIDYDPNVDALNITFRKGKVERTIELEYEINLDMDASGRPISLEVLGAKDKFGEKDFSKVQLHNLEAVTS
ncbi:MAG: DUF2283 domain-containing protein [Candidatus Paceibacterota bacterium]